MVNARLPATMKSIDCPTCLKYMRAPLIAWVELAYPDGVPELKFPDWQKYVKEKYGGKYDSHSCARLYHIKVLK